jgi:endoribonuclease Dicer
MEEINVIVFDEAHHALGSDPYARIMNDHYRTTPRRNRPKIFGMTASPVKTTTQDCHLAVAELQKMLDAKIFTARLGLLKEIDDITGQPIEHAIEYKKATFMGTGRITQLITEKCSHLAEIHKHLNRMSFNDAEYGPLVSDLAWLGHTDEMKGRVKRKLEQAGALDKDCNLASPEWISTHGIANMRKVTSDEAEINKKTKWVQDAVVNSAISEMLKSYPPMPDTLIVDSTNATPKILALIKLLEDYGASTDLQQSFCGIMFVKRQQTVIALCELLKRIPSLQSWLRPEWVTGHNHDHGQGMDPKKQADTLRRFKKGGSTNLLISTTVLEEGMDVTSCNAVIRFDLYDHHVSYLQSKGRARHKYSMFFVLVEEGNEQHFNLINTVNMVDQKIKACWRDLPEDQGAIACMDSGSGSDSDDCDTEIPEEQLLTLKSASTGACLRPLDCVSIVCRYVGSLSRDEFSLQKPDFFYKEVANKRYQVELRFPANAHAKVRTVLGPECSSRRLAARMASFEACKLLFELNELDEHLLPRKVKKVKSLPVTVYREMTLRTQLHPVERRVAFVYDDGIAIAENINGPIVLHGIVINTSTAYTEHNSRPILVLFPSPTAALPAVELFMDCPRVIPATEDSVEISFTGEQAKAACQYSYQMMCLIGRREWQCDKLPYLMLPIASSLSDSTDASMIDWEEVSRPLRPSASRLLECLEKIDNHTMQDGVICEGRQALSERLCKVTAVRQDLNPYSFRECRNPALEEEKESYLAAYVRKRGFNMEALPVSPDQPMIEAVTIPRMTNMLDSLNKNRQIPRKVFFIPSLTSFVQCSASFLRSCLLLPSIMERYDQVFLARELNRDLLGGCVDEKHLVEALTLSRTGQSTNYERLEYDGDCYLKVLATTWAFAKCDSHREGDLNHESKSVLCNAALLKITLSKKIAEYATGQRMTAKKWRPLFMKLSSDASEAEVPTMSSKTMADLVESILGAAWASSSDPMDLSKPSECATRLEILGHGVKADLRGFQSIFDGQVKAKEEEGDWRQRVEVGTLTRLQDELGYTFKSPHLALEAVTHSSMLDSGLPSYERLEFLGDAVLDLLVVSLFKIKFPQLDAGGATAIKGNAICNASLAVLCVDLELYRFLMHSHKIMAESIAAFREDLEAAKKTAIEAAGSNSDLAPYWHDLKPPKVLADLVEAMLGAVYVDSGFDILTAKAFFDRMYRSHFDKYFQPETSLVRSPYDFVRIIKSHECTEWDIQVQLEEENEQGFQIVQCTLLFHGLVITRQKSRRGKVIAQYKDDLDKKRKEIKHLHLSDDEINGSGLKTILQACFPGNFIRDSEKVLDDKGDVVDLKVQNQYAPLHAICQCKKDQRQEDETEQEVE